MVRRTAAVAVCLAALWLLYGICAELFIAWYSGVEYEVGAFAWVAVLVQAGVNVFAICLAWRIVRGRSPTPAP